MKKVLVFLAVCIMFLSATPAFAATLSYTAPTEVTVNNGLASLSIKVDAGNQSYAALRFQLALPESVTITKVSYTAAGNYTVQAPYAIPDEDGTYDGITIFGIYDKEGNRNGINGDVTCTLELSYTGSTKQTITIKEITQSIITGQQTSDDYKSASSDVILKTSSTTSSTTSPSGTNTSGSGGSGGNPTTVTITDLDVPTGSIRFSDVTEGHWAYEFIEYLAGRGFVNGKTATTFGPSDNITRAEFVTILARMSGDTLPAYSGTFSDVDTSAYYAQAVAWAVQAGVTQGTSATTFSPNNRITRQDIATMLVRYANYKNISFAAANAAATFADDAQISAYAKETVSTMQRAGVVSGNTDGTFRPLNNATRAEASKMLALVHHAMSK